MQQQGQKGFLVGVIETADGDWMIWHRNLMSGGGWYSFTLEAPGKVRQRGSTRRGKRWYSGGWNGQRLARSHEMGLLAERFPEVLQLLELLCPTLQWDA